MRSQTFTFLIKLYIKCMYHFALMVQSGYLILKLYALKRAHMHDNFLRDAKVSEFVLFVRFADLAAFFCTLSNALI